MTKYLGGKTDETPTKNVYKNTITMTVCGKGCIM